MKKLLCVLCALCIMVSFAACSSAPKEAPEDATKAPETTTVSSNAIDKNIDAVAEYLGYTDGEETLYNMIGANAGKEYDGGNFELYEFTEDSESYQTAINGGGLVKAAAYKDGIVLVFAGEANQELIDQFNAIEFK